MNPATLSPTRYVASVVLAAGAAVALMGMSGPKPKAKSGARPAAEIRKVPGTEAGPTNLRIVARDFGYDLPATVASGPTRIQLVNGGHDLHHAQLVRLTQGKTLRDLAAFPHDAPPPAWVVMVGGPGAVAPGDSSAVVQDLAPGNYAVLCFIPGADKVPHVAKGMAAGFTVLPRHNGARVPEATNTVRLVDFGFAPARAFKAGKQFIRVVNDAVQPHEIVVFKLLPGKTATDLHQWQMSLQGPPPAQLIGGTVGLAQSTEALVELTLEPGNYVFTCFIPDAKSGKPHFMHGMSLPVVVAS